MTILLDVNLSPDWIQILETHALKVIHWSSIGATDATDQTITDYARREGFVILTQDLDLGTILSISGEHRPSVLLLRAGRTNPAIMGMQVIAALDRLHKELTTGALVTIEPRRTRMTLLPIGKHV